jgi:thiol:disulfide interchange protein
MKNWGLLALLALPTIASSVPAAPAKKAAGAVKWHPTYESALAEAKKTGKPVFVDFYTTWCGPCKYLDAVTYKDAKFVQESKNWVLVKVDAEKNPSNVKLAEKFKVTGYPTMVFLKSNGKEADRAVGGYPPEMLVPKMKKAAQKAIGGKSI